MPFPRNRRPPPCIAQAAQQMKFFLDGRGLSNRSFFTEEMFRLLKAPKPEGSGLRFRIWLG